jgi:hypothetical protein
MTRYLKFKKETNGEWYVVLPEWEGEHSDLEMVLGADTMCDIIAQGEWEIEIGLSTDKQDHFKFELTFREEEGGGGWYTLKGDFEFQFEVWLCYVTTFVFGELPQKIYVI